MLVGPLYDHVRCLLQDSFLSSQQLLKVVIHISIVPVKKPSPGGWGSLLNVTQGTNNIGSLYGRTPKLRLFSLNKDTSQNIMIVS